MRKINNAPALLEQRIISDECEKAQLERQLNLIKIREHNCAINRIKSGGII